MTVPSAVVPRHAYRDMTQISQLLLFFLRMTILIGDFSIYLRRVFSKIRPRNYKVISSTGAKLSVMVIKKLASKIRQQVKWAGNGRMSHCIFRVLESYAKSRGKDAEGYCI